jgi:hypothetical protein
MPKSSICQLELACERVAPRRPVGCGAGWCRAADLHAESDAALNNLAQVLADEGRFAEAQSAVRRALALDGPNKMVAERTLREIRKKSRHIQNDDDSGTASPR